MDDRNRKARRAARAEGPFDSEAFLKLADKFIDLANRQNTRVNATDLHMAFLYAAARYNAHVGKSVLDVADHEIFVKDMTDHFADMLRQHMADPSVGKVGVTPDT